MSEPTGASLQVKFYVSGADLDRLRAFAVREGFPSLHMAARVLMLGAIDDYPKWGVLKRERADAAQAVRTRAWREFTALCERLLREAEAGDAVDRNAETTIEKGQVTFSRENQE